MDMRFWAGVTTGYQVRPAVQLRNAGTTIRGLVATGGTPCRSLSTWEEAIGHTFL
jgi:hypothetical protein